MVAPNTLTNDDFKLKGQVGRRGTRTLINVQEIAAKDGSYRYLEIGSYLGKSLQPHVMDDDCIEALSIDLRPEMTPDARGALDQYKHVTTQDMLDGLRQYANDSQMQKLSTRETTTASLRSDPPEARFDLAFIDGEHTIAAAFTDFLNVLTVMKEKCVVVFDDTHIIYPAVQNATSYLESLGAEHAVVFGGGYISAIFIGPDAGVRATMLKDSNRIPLEVLEAKYDEVLADSYVKRSMTRLLRQQPDLRSKAVRCLRNLGYRISSPDGE